MNMFMGAPDVSEAMPGHHRLQARERRRVEALQVPIHRVDAGEHAAREVHEEAVGGQGFERENSLLASDHEVEGSVRKVV